jgi:lysophospholipase L1-like esterase
MRPASVALRLLPTLAVLLVTGAALQRADWPRFDACYSVEYDIYVPDPELGYGFRPGADVQGATVNAEGLRGPVLTPEKAAGTLRVLTVGDSTAWGLGVREPEAFAALAPRLLAAALPGRRVEYAIGALPGYSSYQSRVLLRRLLPLQPDLVVFYLGARNDLTKGSYYPDSAIPARMRRRQAAWHHVKLLLAGENLVDFFHKEVLVKLRAKRDRARVPLDEFRANVRAMLRAAHEAGAASIVLVPPWSQSLLESFPFLVDYRAALEELGREAGATVVPLQPLFATHPEEEVYFPDRLHFNPRGHRIAAEAVRDAVLREGLLPGAASP